MKIRAIASDYDGTLATHGKVPPETVDAIRRYRNSGGQVLLVTGREIDDLRTICPEWKLFPWIVGENGALLYNTELEQEILLADLVPQTFIQELQGQGLTPLYVGRILVATRVEHAPALEQVIQEGKYPLQLILNKDAVMVLPQGVDKAYGLKALVPRLGLSLEEIAGVGDGENDRDLLAACGMAVAVQNATPDLKQIADWVTSGPAGEGFIELVDRLLSS